MTDEELKTSLEADYAELVASLSGQAWKAAHVLAGSIIEALLVDSILSLPKSDQPSKDPLSMDLADLISACRSRKILSERAEQLSSVVRGYRNLIHPGRKIRLQEPVDGDTAKIAHALVEIILKEVGAKRKETYGYTAEQVLNKIEQDSSALAILSHLTRSMQPREFRRLLANLFPKRYFECLAQIPDDPDAADEIADHHPAVRASSLLERAFRPIFDAAPEDARVAATKNFVKILLEESEANVLSYEAAFFRCGDLQYLPPQEVELVKRHLLSRLQNSKYTDMSVLLRLIPGIGSYLTPSEASSFASAVYKAVNQMARRQARFELPSNVGATIAAEYDSLSEEARVEFDGRYDHWVELAKSQGRGATVEALEQLQGWWTPF